MGTYYFSVPLKWLVPTLAKCRGISRSFLSINPGASSTRAPREDEIHQVAELLINSWLGIEARCINETLET